MHRLRIGSFQVGKRIRIFRFVFFRFLCLGYAVHILIFIVFRIVGFFLSIYHGIVHAVKFGVIFQVFQPVRSEELRLFLLHRVRYGVFGGVEVPGVFNVQRIGRKEPDEDRRTENNRTGFFK